MMKKYVWIIIFIVLGVFIVNAQNLNLKKQKGYKYKRSYILDSLKIKEPDFDKIDFELRIYQTDYSVVDDKNSYFLQISKNRNGAWQGNSYHYYEYNAENYNYEDAEIKPIMFKDTWTHTWKTILDKDYLNLPAESAIDKKKLNVVIVIADGTSYCIEVLTKKRKRCMVYSNPEGYYDAFLKEGFDLLEYRTFMEFVDLLRKELHF